MMTQTTQQLPYSCPKCGQNLPPVKGAWEEHVTMVHSKIAKVGD